LNPGKRVQRRDMRLRVALGRRSCNCAMSDEEGLSGVSLNQRVSLIGQFLREGSHNRRPVGHRAALVSSLAIQSHSGIRQAREPPEKRSAMNLEVPR
jgi:hypothetical protein